MAGEFVNGIVCWSGVNYGFDGDSYVYIPVIGVRWWSLESVALGSYCCYFWSELW